jgi:hypothetical protein
MESKEGGGWSATYIKETNATNEPEVYDRNLKGEYGE